MIVRAWFIVVVVLVFLVSPRVGVQTLPTWTAHTTLVSFWDAQIARIDGGSDTNYHVDLTITERNTWQIALEQCFVGDVVACRTNMNRLGVEVYSFTDTTNNIPYWIIREIANPGTPEFKGFGTFMIDREPLRNIAVLAPHMPHDTNSGYGVRRYVPSARPRLIGLNGVHRCANFPDQLTPCTGTSASCGTAGAAYPKSDPAHNIFNSWYGTYKAIKNQEFSLVIEFHTQSTSEPENITLSNGTRVHYDGTGVLIDRLRDSLDNPADQTQFTVGSCSKAAEEAEQNLCSQSGVGGRLLNGFEPDMYVCMVESAVVADWPATHKWLHIEADSSIWSTSANYNVLFAALNANIPQDMGF